MLLVLGKLKYIWDIEAIEVMSFLEQCRLVNYQQHLLVIAWYIVYFHFSPVDRSKSTAILLNWKNT